MQGRRSNPNRAGGRCKPARRPSPAAGFLHSLLHFLSYGCLSALVLPTLLLVSWRYINAEDTGPAKDRAQVAGNRGEPGMAAQVPAPVSGVDHRKLRLEESLADQKPGFHVESTELMIGDMPVEQLVLDATEVELNVRELLRGEKARIRSFGSANVSLRITGEALRNQLVPLIEAKGLRDPRIEFGRDSVKITGHKKVRLLGSFKVSAKASFHVQDENAIGIRITELESGQLNLGVSSLKLDFREEVPPLNLGGSYARVVIDRLEFRAGELHVDAHAVPLPAGSIPRNALDVL